MELTFLDISILKTSNINTGHKSMIVSNKTHNLQNRIVQLTGQKRPWIGTVAILKGLKYELSFWTSLKSKIQFIQFTDQQTGTLKCWNWTFHMALLKALKYTPCLSFWSCQKTIVEITDLTRIIYWPAIIA